MVRRSPKMLDFRVGCGSGRWGAELVFFDLFSRGPLKRFFSMLGRIWEVLGGQNGGQNRFLGRFFAMLFSSAFRHRFRDGFGRLRTLKICTAPRREHDFYKIDVFEKNAKKTWFWNVFRSPKPPKIKRKLCWKTYVFLTSIFWRFFAMFFSSVFLHRFWSVFWRLRTLKICTAPKREHDFYKIDVFEKCAKKARFRRRFGRPKRRKIVNKLG